MRYKPIAALVRHYSANQHRFSLSVEHDTWTTPQNCMAILTWIARLGMIWIIWNIISFWYLGFEGICMVCVCNVQIETLQHLQSEPHPFPAHGPHSPPYEPTREPTQEPKQELMYDDTTDPTYDATIDPTSDTTIDPSLRLVKLIRNH